MPHIVLSLFLPSLLFTFLILFPDQQIPPPDEDYLTWSAERSVTTGKAWRANGRVGGALDLRVIHTEHSYNYKLRATLMSPEAIRATARLEQLRSHLSDDQTRAMVREAENMDQLVVLVEIDAREGSGVIPLDWRVTLQPRGAKLGAPTTIQGQKMQKLREIRALSGVARRDYAYDVFWVAFPLATEDGTRAWKEIPNSLELIVGIHNKEGRVTWPVSIPLFERLKNLSTQVRHGEQK